MLFDVARDARDRLFAIITRSKPTTSVKGVVLSLSDVSPRMRYVMCRGYESEDADLLARVLTPDDSVLEAGGAVGFLAIYSMKILGVRNYCLVEANPRLLSAISRNFALNGLKCPHVVNAAVVDTDGKVSFGVNRDFWSSSMISRSGQEMLVEVPGQSLLSLIAALPFQPNTLIMDIEGGEAAIPCEHFSPFHKIVMETHRKLVGNDRIDALLQSLARSGFRQIAQIGGSVALVRDCHPGASAAG
jgi:FkbM family methyltransferase